MKKLQTSQWLEDSEGSLILCAENWNAISYAEDGRKRISTLSVFRKYLQESLVNQISREKMESVCQHRGCLRGASVNL